LFKVIEQNYDDLNDEIALIVDEILIKDDCNFEQ
jgi:hypothetical protein